MQITHRFGSYQISSLGGSLIYGTNSQTNFDIAQLTKRNFEASTNRASIAMMKKSLNPPAFTVERMKGHST
jgi:hypothetical protein